MKTTLSIASIKDERVVEARSLNTASGRRNRRKCLLEGEQIVGWALASGMTVERVFFAEHLTAHPLLVELAERNVLCLPTTAGILKKISATSYLIPFLGVAMVPGHLPTAAGDFLLVLDDVRDFGNIGTIIRTTRAFGVRDVVTTRDDTDLYHTKVIEASRGTVFGIRYWTFASAAAAMASLKKRGFQIVATSPHARQLQSSAALQEKPMALVIGNESSGVSPEVLREADLVVQIPMAGNVESLNVGVAAGISIHEFKIKWVMEMLKKLIQKNLGREVNVTGKQIQLAFDARLKQTLPFDSKQVIFLMKLKCDKVMTRPEAGRDMALFGDDLHDMIEPLAVGGYVANDGAESLSLTALGEHLLGQLWPIVEQAEADVVEGFNAEEKKQLADFLQRLQGNCRKIIEGK